jgi:prepilin-type N-terminal cleavage/methylation domain-containing protein
VIRNEKGFTAIEIIAVMIILGILAALIVPRIITLDDSAARQALKHAVEELNTRERLVWTNVKLSGITKDIDETVWQQMKEHLDVGADEASIDIEGGTLRVGSTSITISRTPSNYTQPGVWKEQ